MKVQYGSCTLTFRKATVGDRLAQRQLWRKLASLANDEEIEALAFYVDFLTLCQIDGDIGFNVPDVKADEEAIIEGYHALLNADEELYFVIIDTLNKVSEPIADSEVTPIASEKKVKS